MKKRLRQVSWAKTLMRSVLTMTQLTKRSTVRSLSRLFESPRAQRICPVGAGTSTAGVAIGASGSMRYVLYRPPNLTFGMRLPLMVMLHGCGQDAASFAASTRMNRVALREGFLVLYPEQDRLSNRQRCWNWFDTRNRRAYGESALIMNAIDQVCLLHTADRTRVCIAGLSAGASMAALLVTQHPERFKALVMHSGIPPGTAHSAMSALVAMHRHRPTLALASSPSATAADWPALLVIHGDADAVVSPHHGCAAVHMWADAAGALADGPRRQQRGQRYPMCITDFKRAGRIAATLVAVKGLGHAWSGGAGNLPFSDPKGPDASRMTWAFAARQFRRLVSARVVSARHQANAP